MVPGGTVTHRAFQHLYPLEIEGPISEETDNQSEHGSVVNQAPPPGPAINLENQIEQRQTTQPDRETALRRSKRIPKLIRPFSHYL